MAVAHAGSLCWRCRGGGGAPWALEEQGWGVARRVGCLGAPRAEVERRRGPQNGWCSPGGGPWVPGPGGRVLWNRPRPRAPRTWRARGVWWTPGRWWPAWAVGRGTEPAWLASCPPTPAGGLGAGSATSVCASVSSSVSGLCWPCPGGSLSSAWRRRAPRGCSLATHRLPWPKGVGQPWLPP